MSAHVRATRSNLVTPRPERCWPLADSSRNRCACELSSHALRSRSPASVAVGPIPRTLAYARASRTCARSSAELSPSLDPSRMPGSTRATSMTMSIRSKQRAADTPLVAFNQTGSAGAAPLGIAVEAARARVRRAHQREAGREPQPAFRPHQGDVAVFQRLPERLQRRRTELGHLVEEEHAVVRERRLAGSRRRLPLQRGRRSTRSGAVHGTAGHPQAPARRQGRPRNARAPSRRAPHRPGRAGSWAAAGPAWSCPSPAARSSGCCARPRQRSAARAWRARVLPRLRNR